MANFPIYIGAVDKRHICLQKPPKSGSMYFNYKKYFFVVLMAVADTNYKYVAIKVGVYGDSRALLTSQFGQVLQAQETLLLHVFRVPPSRSICHGIG